MRKRRKKVDTDNINTVVAFKNAIKEGPYYICVVCNRNLYKKTVKLFALQNYNMDILDLFTNVESFDKSKYVCFTCDRHLKKKEIPCQAVWNKLSVDDLPGEIKSLNRLEKVLISKIILFKKISIMSKGQQPKIKGSVCNIPILLLGCG